jgi:hypothetical protein
MNKLLISRNRFIHKSRNLIFLLTVAMASASLVCSTARAADSCQPVFDALNKLARTPNHSYATGTLAPTNGGGEVIEGEKILANGQYYLRTHGKWLRLPVTSQDVLDQEKDKELHGKSTCQFLRSESINGEAAALYSVHREYVQASDKVIEDSQMWISKSTGLPLRAVVDWENFGIHRKEHRTDRFEYGDIRPPM